MSIAEKLQTITENEQKVYEAGKNDLGMEMSKGKTNFAYMFQDCLYLKALPQMYTSSGNTFRGMCAGCKNLTTVQYMDFSNATIVLGAFQYCSSLTTLPSLNAPICESFSYAFLDCINLVTISEIDMSSATSCNLMFNNCHNLENINFKGVIPISISFGGCGKLTDESVTSIINALKDLTGQTAQSLTLNANIANKLTDEQKTTITLKNWNLVY